MPPAKHFRILRNQECKPRVIYYKTAARNNHAARYYSWLDQKTVVLESWSADYPLNDGWVCVGAEDP